MSDEETAPADAQEPGAPKSGPPAAADPPPARRRGLRPPGYLSVFGFALLLLLCAAAAAALANFRPNTTRMAWASIWLSGAAVLFTAAALFIRAPRS